MIMYMLAGAGWDVRYNSLMTLAGVWLAFWVDAEVQQVHPALQGTVSVGVGLNDQVLQTAEADSSTAIWTCVAFMCHCICPVQRCCSALIFDKDCLDSSLQNVVLWKSTVYKFWRTAFKPN